MATVKDFQDHYRANKTWWLDKLETSIHQAAESPIEELMMWALIGHYGAQWFTAMDFESTYVIGGDATTEFMVAYPDTWGKSYVPMLGMQPTVIVSGRKYRLDLCLRMYGKFNTGAEVYIDIECDGHDFHEKTKEQAENDKRRDRDLQSIGWVIARFTGSEIYRDPAAAAQSVADLAAAQLKLRLAKVGGL